MKRVLVCILLISLFACKTTKQVKSVSDLNMLSESYYNKASKINYKLANDSEFLYLQLKTNERSTVMKMMGTGLTFYFDKEGKKNKDVQIQSPVGGKGRGRRQNQEQISLARRRSDPSELLAELTNEAIITIPGTLDKRLVRLEDTDIEAEVKAGGFGGIIYTLKVPFSFLNVEGPDELRKLSIGIVSGRLTDQRGAGERRPGAIRGPIGAGGRGRGARPGGMRPGGGGMRNASGLTEPVKFWFRADLIEDL